MSSAAIIDANGLKLAKGYGVTHITHPKTGRYLFYCDLPRDGEEPVTKWVPPHLRTQIERQSPERERDDEAVYVVLVTDGNGRPQDARFAFVIERPLT